ncbi:MAG: hypothetical protein EBV30_04465 [Actinobacteria bacterium]|nr:hypothetical protein [Actinomycetota bacterium]
MRQARNGALGGRCIDQKRYPAHGSLDSCALRLGAHTYSCARRQRLGHGNHCLCDTLCDSLRCGDLGSHALIFGILVLLGTGALVVSQSHRLKRFTALLDPFSVANYQSAGWQPAHGIMALATGGLFGVGLGAGSQKWGNLGPEAHTDFIFAVIGEEVGLFGTLMVVAIFGIILWCGCSLAVRVKDNFSRLIAVGITAWIVFQALTNMGSSIGVFPVIGVPLPFVSYGGSSLISTLAAVAILLRIAHDRAKP